MTGWQPSGFAPTSMSRGWQVFFCILLATVAGTYFAQAAPQEDAAAKKAASTAQDAPGGNARAGSSDVSNATAASDGSSSQGNWGDQLLRFTIIVGVILVALVLPFWLGGVIARRTRAREYGWRIGLTLASVICAALILLKAWDPEQNRLNLPLGVDLKGGVILVYEVQENLDQADQESQDKQADTTGDGSGQAINMGQLCQAIKNRIDPAGTQEIVVRPYGSDHVEVIIPQVDALEVDRIKRLISTAGALEFRIVANSKDHNYHMTVAREQANSNSIAERTRRQVIDSDGTEIAFWARVARDSKKKQGVFPFKVDVSPDRELLRVAVHESDPDRVGRIIELPTGVRPGDMVELAKYLESEGIKQIDVLMYKDEYNVEGRYLGVVKPDYDERGNICVSFTLRGAGVGLFSQLTGQNVPDPQTGFARRLGIVLDKTLLSAPNIQSRISRQGQITGKFSQEEIDFLVGILRSGRLPAALDPVPISENNIGSELGEETIRKGKLSIIAALLSVLVFIVIYYRFAGIVACVALLLNLLFILALMVLLHAPLTLPGLAGLVLTVGMSVDANVLIFERIREELRRGAALRMAIRNGFGRATSTIVDANVTTLITAIVLYSIGTDQIRGFAVTLIFGILMSMYTAIFVSRIVFELAERQRKLKKLTMMHILTQSNIDFIGKRTIAAAVSVILIAIGLVATYQRGTGLLDIDFNGGSAVTFVLREPMPAQRVRDHLREEFAKDKETVQFTVNEMTQVGHEAQTLFRVTSSLRDEQQLIDRIVHALQREGGTSVLETYSVRVESIAPSGNSAAAPNQPAASQGTIAVLVFEHPINGATLLEQIHAAEEAAGVQMGDPILSAVDDQGNIRFVDPTDLRPLGKWQIQFPADQATTQKVLDQLQTIINTRPVIPEASKIGGKVAEDTKANAMWALLTSLIGIIAYIWFRFQRLQYGLAAVIALVHDVLITLGALAVSKWLAGALGFLLVEEFKISLPVVAAFLTIVGYSLNDTIVVFDRIREVRGKSPDLTAGMINTSINQTLSRTLLTSVTTLIVVLILYFFGGEGIHSFAFALVTGVVVGTYSSIFIASPALLWMLDLTKKQQASAGGRPTPTAAATAT